jgi:integrase
MSSGSASRNDTQAAVDRVLALSQRDKTYSAGTVRTYQQHLVIALEWDRENGGNGLHAFDRERATAFLTERAKTVRQRTLDTDREALQILPGLVNLPTIRSHVRATKHRSRHRQYTDVYIAMVAAAQDDANGLATMIAAAAGLRAHELLTLRQSWERPASTHITWLQDRFVGFLNAKRYTVIGNSGIVREVAIPVALAKQLEAVRLFELRQVTDRSVKYETQYDIGGGQAWSQSFGRASKRVLGWSIGAHSLRDTYAESRLDAIQLYRSYDYDEAWEIIRQELGNWRPQLLHDIRVHVSKATGTDHT